MRCIAAYTFECFLNYILNLDELFHLVTNVLSYSPVAMRGLFASIRYMDTCFCYDGDFMLFFFFPFFDISIKKVFFLVVSCSMGQLCTVKAEIILDLVLK